MINFKFIVIGYCIYIASGFDTVLNIEELNSVHYSIDIISNPVLKDQEWKTDIITVVNKFGQEYVCSLPKVEIPENENKKEEDILDQLVDISELLKPMEAAPCLIKKKDWWSYEFCYGSVIKQYHLEDNKVTGTILILGRYESEYNWKNSSETKNKLRKFHSQFYVNGTRCDITGEPRRTEVRFHCEEGVGDYIQLVDEPESCRYIVTVATTRVCHHPYLKPSPNKSPYSISCAPALNQDQFERYQKVETLKRHKAELERQNLLEERELKENSEVNESNGLDGTDGDNDEEMKWSIRLVTIPLSKKGRLDNAATNEGSLFTEGLSERSDDIETPSETVDYDSTKTDSEELSDEKFKELLKKDQMERDTQDNEATNSYMSEDEVFEKEINKLVQKIYENEEKKEENEEKAESDASTEQALQQMKSIRNKMNKIIGKWLEIQNEEHMQELSLKVAQNLGENVQNLQKTASKLPDEILSDYVDEIVKIASDYKKQVEEKIADLGELEAEDEQKLLEVLDTLTKTLSEAEMEVLRTKKRIHRLEKLLNSHLEDISKEDKDEISSDSHNGASSHQDRESGSSPSLSNPSNTKSVPKVHNEEDSVDSNHEELEEDENTGELKEYSKGDTRQVRILNERSLDESHKTKLEQSIKERLQKSGLDNLGRKIEVKILTPNYLDDEEKDTLSTLSQEETEAFHNMIVNILSASAEELQERERQKSIESSYNFQLDDRDFEKYETDTDMKNIDADDNSSDNEDSTSKNK